MIRRSGSGARLVATILKPWIVPDGFIADVGIAVADVGVSVVRTRLPLTICETIFLSDLGVSVVRTRLPLTICQTIFVPDLGIGVVGTRLPLTIFNTFVFAGARVCPTSNRLIAAIAQTRIQLVGPIFQLLRFGALTLCLSQTLLCVPLAFSGAQFGFGTLPSCRSSSFIGCRLRRLGLGSKSLSFLTGISSLDCSALIGLSPHSR
jgi:hypothetical protein